METALGRPRGARAVRRRADLLKMRRGLPAETRTGQTSLLVFAHASMPAPLLVVARFWVFCLVDPDAPVTASLRDRRHNFGAPHERPQSRSVALSSLRFPSQCLPGHKSPGPAGEYDLSTMPPDPCRD